MNHLSIKLLPKTNGRGETPSVPFIALLLITPANTFRSGHVCPEWTAPSLWSFTSTCITAVSSSSQTHNMKPDKVGFGLIRVPALITDVFQLSNGNVTVKNECKKLWGFTCCTAELPPLRMEIPSLSVEETMTPGTPEIRQQCSEVEWVPK